MLRRLRNLSLVMVLTAAVVLGVSPASPAAAATGVRHRHFKAFRICRRVL